MADLINRPYQKDLLFQIANAYPEAADVDTLPNIGGNSTRVNLRYLEEHGLVEVQWASSFDGMDPIAATITAAGIDFIADDGGLSAILGVVTFRMHPDTVRNLFIREVLESSEKDDDVKKKTVEKLKSLPAEAIGTVTEEALKQGLSRIPDLARWLFNIAQNSGG